MKKFLVMITNLLLVLSMLTGCSGNANESGNEAGSEKVLIAGTSAGYFGATNLDPADSWNGWYLSFFGMSETLFRLDESYTANPWLVESCENTDDNTWKLVLRNDVFFHNGEKMTAESVKKCFERTYTVNARAEETLKLSEITSEGQTLTLKTSEPNPTIMSDLCDPLFSVYYVGEGVDYKAAASCTGPFQMESFTPNVEIDLVKYENYWGGVPNLDKAVLKTINDADALTMAIQSGELDIAVSVPSSALSVCSDPSKYVIYSAATTRGHFLRFNMEKAVVKDNAVREAIAMCIDREGYSKVISQNSTNPNYGVYPNTLSYGNIVTLNPLITKYDVAGAKAKLLEAGYQDADGDGILEKNGVALNIKLATISTRSEFIEFCDVLTSALKEVGIDLQVSTYEKLDSAEAYQNADFDISLDSKGMAPTGNAQYFINTDFITSGSMNYGHYSNARVDELAGKLATTFCGEKRNDITCQIEQEILNDTSFVFFANQNFMCIASPDVTDFEIQPSEYYFLDAKVGMK